MTLDPSLVHPNGFIDEDANKANVTDDYDASTISDGPGFNEAVQENATENNKPNVVTMEDAANEINKEYDGTDKITEPNNNGIPDPIMLDATETEEDNFAAMAELFELAKNPFGLNQDKNHAMLRKFEDKIETLISMGYKVTCKDGRKWKIVENSFPKKRDEHIEPIPAEHKEVGVRSYKFSRLLLENKPFDQHALVALFSLLWPGDWKKHMGRINRRIILDKIKMNRQQSTQQISKTNSDCLLAFCCQLGELSSEAQSSGKVNRRLYLPDF